MKTALPFLIGLTLAGCVSVMSMDFTYRDPVSIDPNKLKLQGYYDIAGDSGLGAIMLWEDGTAVFLRREFPPAELSRKRQTYGPDWGAFRVNGDRISVQILTEVPPGGLNRTYRVAEYNGQILSDTTFVLKEFTYLGWGAYRDPSRTDYRYSFRPLEKKPSSENWTDKYR